MAALFVWYHFTTLWTPKGDYCVLGAIWYLLDFDLLIYCYIGRPS